MSGRDNGIGAASPIGFLPKFTRTVREVHKFFNRNGTDPSVSRTGRADKNIFR